MSNRPRSVSRISYVELKELDQLLEGLNLRRHSVPKDGNSFFSAVSHQLSLFGKTVPPQNVRRKCVEYLRRNDRIGDILWWRAIDTAESKDAYLFRNSQEEIHADDIMIQAAASATGFLINVISVGETLRVEPHTALQGEIFVAQINGFNFISLEGTPNMENGTLPRLFNLRDLISARGVDPRQPRSPDAINHMNPLSFDGDNDQGDPQQNVGMFGHGLNPLEDENEDFFNSPNDEEALLEKPAYDQFICEPPEDDRRTTSPLLKFSIKTFKFFSYFVFGGMVLGCGLVSKASLMVLINSAKPLASTDGTTESDLEDHDIMRVWAYIILLVTMLVPEVVTMTYSLYRIIMRRETLVDKKTLLWGLLWEVLHAFGESILILRVFPHLDATFVILCMPLIAIVPIVLHVHAKYGSVTQNSNSKKNSPSEHYKRIRNLVMAVTALILQLGGLVTMFGGFFFNKFECNPSMTCSSESHWFCFLCPDYTYIWAVVGIILTSVRYWENFVAGSFHFTKHIRIQSWKLHNKLDNARFQTSFIYSFVKCLIVAGMTFFVLVVLENESYVSPLVLDGTRPYSGQRYSNIVSLFTSTEGKRLTRGAILEHLWYVFAVQTCASFVTFFMGRVSCLTMIQRESFTFPLMLITPILSAISAALGVYKQNVVPGVVRDLTSYLNLEAVREVRNLRYYVDWNNVVSYSQENEAQVGVFTPGVAAVGVLIGLLVGYFGIVLVTHFLWGSPFNRLERMEMLFVKPFYGSILVDQVMLLNRRQYEHEYSVVKQKKEEQDEERRRKKEEKERKSSGSIHRRKSSRRVTISRGHKFIPQLFLCATMWHETEEEMTQILTSLMRLDRDQGNRRPNARNDDDYYNFQVHILFDDAMEKTKDGKQLTTNKFVHQLVTLIPLAANKVQLGKGYDLPTPVIYPTPYGGRLEFVLPHGNLLIVHLKDKEKIRHRKRWSQCMYMYYILGYLQANKRAYKLEDVFLLALDGDVDFQPNAVLLLLDRMKRNPDVGAACGRIHPTGSGPVVWFQKFEYAVGHWLQKTAEHVLGCVLCSPGCFSLFRGSALVDVNVINQYTTKATEARHYVQWDQGEDRWLCTLLLKRGWRIEYSAASDSFTFAPEDFKEFYNQRRRWGPSTMANIFDILMDARLAVKNNIYLSWGYIAYQLGLMISSLLGPATVIMIVQGSFQYVFQWGATLALIVSLIPVVIFIVLCYTTSADTQIAVAGIMTILYALVMMAVVVGVIGSMVTNLFLDPNNIFMMVLVGLYAFTGILHPQEVMCLSHGVLYYLCVPSAFILMMVYSLTNLNNVSWGTREVKPAVPDEGTASEQALEEVANKSKRHNFQVGPDSVYDAPNSSDGYYSCGLGNLCQCALCITPKPVVIQAEPSKVQTSQPHRRQTVVGYRRPTMGPQSRRSMYHRFSVAKSQQITGEENQEVGSKIEQRLGSRISVSQLRRISTRLGSGSMTTSKLRRISTHQRRLSKRSSERRTSGEHQGPMSRAAAELSQELENVAANHELDDFDNQSLNEMYDDEMVDEDRMQDEDEEMLYWVIEGSLEDGVIEYLDDDEREFWKYMIQHYLHPIDEDKAEKDRIKSDLRALRNRVTGAYFLLNALWLILNFALQLTITDIAIVFTINGSVVSVNPVSFAFLIFFLIILIIQFGCMLVHRWSTALHLLSVTTLKWRDGRDDIKNEKKKDVMKAAELQKLKKNKNVGGNGSAFGGGNVRDPFDREATGATNFSMIRRTSSSGYENLGYTKGSDQEETTVSEDDTSEEMYEKINPQIRFSNNPANRTFGSVSRNYITAENGEVERKNSSDINMKLFNEGGNGANKAKGKKSIFSSPAMENVIDRQMQTQMQAHVHQRKDQPKSKTHTAVHFGSLPFEEHDEDQNTPC